MEGNTLDTWLADGGALQGRTALVTGSSRGIGAAIAQLLASEGARVVVHGRDVEALDAVRATIAATGADVLAVPADLTRFDEIEDLRARVEAAFGPVDVLVANAGGNPVPPGPVAEISEAGWQATMDANLTSTFLTVKCFLPGMQERGHGSIVTMSSAAARRPTAHTPAAYAAAKAGIELLTRTLAIQAGPHGVRVNCIAPETILTERNQSRIPADVQRALVDSHPIRRLGTPEDIARAALFLAAEQSSWITGVVLDVAGGAVLA